MKPLSAKALRTGLNLSPQQVSALRKRLRELLERQDP